MWKHILYVYLFIKFIKTYILVLTYLHLMMSFSYNNNIFIQSLGKYFSLGPVVNDTFQVFKFPCKNHTYILPPETRKAYICYNLGKLILYWFMISKRLYQLHYKVKLNI